MVGVIPLIIVVLTVFFGVLAICYNLYYRHSNNNSNKGLMLETHAQTVHVHEQDVGDDVPVAKWLSETNEQKNKREDDDGFESMDGGRKEKRVRHRRIKTPKKSKPKSRLKKRKY